MPDMFQCRAQMNILLRGMPPRGIHSADNPPDNPPDILFLGIDGMQPGTGEVHPVRGNLEGKNPDSNSSAVGLHYAT